MLNLITDALNQQMEQAIIRYHIAHQLVSYGPANFNLDARINDVIAPSKKALYARVNPICANPIIEIQNTGVIRYNVIS